MGTAVWCKPWFCFCSLPCSHIQCWIIVKSVKLLENVRLAALSLLPYNKTTLSTLTALSGRDAAVKLFQSWYWYPGFRYDPYRVRTWYQGLFNKMYWRDWDNSFVDATIRLTLTLLSYLCKIKCNKKRHRYKFTELLSISMMVSILGMSVMVNFAFDSPDFELRCTCIS